MKVIKGFPPNIKEIEKAFKFPPTAVFTYGDEVYTPLGYVTDNLMIHEETHAKQQKNPEQWWKKYIEDKDFRISQEVEAYHNQYEYYRNDKKSKNKWRSIDIFLHSIAKDFSSEMYGNCISYDEARKRIVEG